MLKIIESENYKDLEELKEINIIKGDCLHVFNKLAELGIAADFILTDIPYGTTKCKWDQIIPFDEMWAGIRKIRKNNTPTLLFAQTPFDKLLGASNIKELKYEWIWEKTQATGYLNAKKMPLKAHENILAFHDCEDDEAHENILVFYKKLGKYNPIMSHGHKPINSYTKKVEVQNKTEVYGKIKKEIKGGGETTRYPRSVLRFASDKQKEYFHSTQKPVDLLAYLIETYTNEGDIVVDFTAGSFSTAIACIKTNRKFIGIEKDLEIFEKGKNRIKNYLENKNKN